MCPGHIKAWKSPVVKQLLLAWPRRFWGPLELHEEAGGGLGAEAQDERASSWPQRRGVLPWPPTEQVGFLRLVQKASAQCFLWLMAGLSVGGSLPSVFHWQSVGRADTVRGCALAGDVVWAWRVTHWQRAGGVAGRGSLLPEKGRRLKKTSSCPSCTGFWLPPNVRHWPLAAACPSRCLLRRPPDGLVERAA